MVQICCVDGCDDTKDDVIYFKFPNSRTLKRKWLDAFTPASKVTIDSVVCSQHFLDTQYETVRGKKRLKAKVVPSIFNGSQNKSPKIDSCPPENDKEIPAKTNEIQITTDTNKILPEHRNEDFQTDTGAIDNEDSDSIVKRTDPSITAIDSEANNDIEDIITNYHIKQIRPLNKDPETHTQDGGIEDMITNYHIKQRPDREDTELQRNGEITEIEIEIDGTPSNVIDVDELKDPVFIEVSVDKTGEDQPNQDCLMLLESVQCEVDPSSLMFQDTEQDVDADTGSDVIDLGEKKEDPISLLTSSDDDEVIIEEPKIDTVDVSDETDEDDMPLVKLVDKRPSKSKKAKSKKSTKSKKSAKSTKTKSAQSVQSDVAKFMWGMYEYFCVQCHFKTTSWTEHKKHIAGHTTVIQICQMCRYTTSSKAQFARHKRKHHEEKKFRCHLCDYKARHKMSLIYHLKSHDITVLNSNHFAHEIRLKKKSKVHVCEHCNYETKRLCDMKRHVMRRHGAADDDDEEYVT